MLLSILRRTTPVAVLLPVVLLVAFAAHAQDLSSDADRGNVVINGIAVPQVASSPYAYVRGQDSLWDGGAASPEGANEAAMDAAFGVGGWDLRLLEEGPVVFADGYDVMYVEGGDSTWDEFAALIEGNQTVVEDYVAAGGVLFMNSGPNSPANGTMNLGFGAQLVYESHGNDATAANPAHPIFNGPALPMTTVFTGTYFTHAVVTGAVSGILLDEFGEFGLAETSWGAGHVVIGGMTNVQFQNPDIEAANLRANILSYALSFVPGGGGGGINLVYTVSC